MIYVALEHSGDYMEILNLNDKLPQSNEILTQAQTLDHLGLDSVVDFYENINLITFEKSLSRLRNNYSLQLKARPLDMSDHYQ